MTQNGLILDLLSSGDWACAHAHHGNLAQVCYQLAELVEPDMRETANAIARVAPNDLAQATRGWAEFSCRVRLTALPPKAKKH